jgi:hypothetical protein
LHKSSHVCTIPREKKSRSNNVLFLCIKITL